MKIVALAGGVGGAKLADGLANILHPDDLTVVVNTGDDFEHLGLKICPDLDTVCYTLAGLANQQTGWGREDETWHAFDTIRSLGGPDWFHLGDYDLGLHLERTRRIKDGQLLHEVTHDICKTWGVQHQVLPMTNENVPTLVYTDEGELPFQEYFVHRACRPKVLGFIFLNADQANPAPGVLESIDRADGIIICPSNPWVSIDPILAIPGIRATIIKKKVIAVSPLVGGKALKGPAAKMFSELGVEPGVDAVAEHYKSFLDGLVFDVVDQDREELMESYGIKTLVTDTIMRSKSDRVRLAEEVIGFTVAL